MNDPQARFVGLDLAWGAKARTGLARVDDRGAFLDSTSVITDEEIATWLEKDDGHPVVVAVDAPLVVPNATGQRIGENLVARAFGRYGASPYPSNKGNPLFDPPRALVLAQRHGWDVDPDHVGNPARPACIEVYPHPAMVGLFGLERVLAYKSGKGRTPQSRRLAFAKLMGHLRAITTLELAASTRWTELDRVVQTATRHMHLEAVEDEIDAIVCAHLAWLWHHHRDRLQVYGSLAEGYIVAPPAPRRTP